MNYLNPGQYKTYIYIFIYLSIYLSIRYLGGWGGIFSKPPTIKAARGTIAMKGISGNEKGRPFPLQRVGSPYEALSFPYSGHVFFVPTNKRPLQGPNKNL